MAFRASTRAVALRATQLSKTLLPKSVTPTLRTSSFHTSCASFLVVGEKFHPQLNPTLIIIDFLRTLSWKRVPLIELTSKKKLARKRVSSCEPLRFVFNGSGIPAAFSGTCSKQHLPGFFSHLGDLRQRGIQDIYVISVNDPFVMNAWKDSFGTDSSVRFLSDPQGEWAKAAKLDWDATEIMGNRRSKRFVAVIEDGVVSATFVEPDNTGLSVTSAESVLASI